MSRTSSRKDSMRLCLHKCSIMQWKTSRTSSMKKPVTSILVNSLVSPSAGRYPSTCYYAITGTSQWHMPYAALVIHKPMTTTILTSSDDDDTGEAGAADGCC